MSPLIIDCSTWEEAIAITEWHCLELVVDSVRLSLNGDSWEPFAKNGKSALSVLNRIQAHGEIARIAKALKSSFPRPIPRAMRLERFVRLMETVEKAYSLFPKVAITQAERRRKAKLISSAARVIANELAHPATQHDLSLSLRLLRREGVWIFLPTPMTTQPSYYEALALTAEKMVDLPKVVGNPNSQSAHRLYFIREMTDYFVASYGRPKRSLVLALAALYFDVSDLTSNDLAKYAPVKKSPPKGRLSPPPNTR